MTYLLDTCVVSDFVRGDQPVLSRIQATAPSAIAVSAITVLEVEYGLALRPALARRLRAVVTAFFDAVTVLPLEREDALQAAALRADLKRKGLPVGAYDLLIGATALRRGLTLVTSNTAEFRHIGDLALVDWRGRPPS
ncbi:MAG TPA: type II toxin-antitoxin system VapC family toxin [Vicinamibacterales bacterium]|jgi:tRNA(fMet)-specific endonuclease VapC